MTVPKIAPNIRFSEFDFYDLYRSTFEKSELGRMKKLLPLHALAENFGLVSESMRPKLGRKSYFTAEGKVVEYRCKFRVFFRPNFSSRYLLDIIFLSFFIRSPRSLHTWTSRSMLPDYPSASSKLPKVNSSQI